MLPLKGIKVIDMTRFLSGPYCTMVLADFGAEVIKVETPKTGDDARQQGPFINGESGYYLSINRNKKSITVDTKTPEGVQLIKDLVKDADVIVENFKAGLMDKLGLGYEELKKVNPGIIMTSISGFGQTGPYKDRPAFDAVVQAMGGIMSITGPGPGQYTRIGASIGDLEAGVFAAIATLLAIIKKKDTGEGSWVDISMLDCQVAILENAIARYFATGVAPQPKGNKHASSVPFEDFECKDGVKLMIAIASNPLFAKLCNALEIPEVATDPRFASNKLRFENYDAIKEILVKKFLEKDAEVWYKTLVDAGVPCSLISTIDLLVKNEQVVARNMIIDFDHPVAGNTHVANTPIRISGVEGGFRTVPPLLGADTEEVLKGLGKTDEEIAALREKGAI